MALVAVANHYAFYANDSFHANNGMGRALFEQGKYQESIAYFDESMRINSSYSAFQGREEAADMLSLLSLKPSESDDIKYDGAIEEDVEIEDDGDNNITQSLISHSQRSIEKYSESLKILEVPRNEIVNEYESVKEVARAFDMYDVD